MTLISSFYRDTAALKTIADQITNALKSLEVPDDTYTYYVHPDELVATIHSAYMLEAYATKLSQIETPQRLGRFP